MIYYASRIWTYTRNWLRGSVLIPTVTLLLGAYATIGIRANRIYGWARTLYLTTTNPAAEDVNILEFINVCTGRCIRILPYTQQNLELVEADCAIVFNKHRTVFLDDGARDVITYCRMLSMPYVVMPTLQPMTRNPFLVFKVTIGKEEYNITLRSPTKKTDYLMCNTIIDLTFLKYYLSKENKGMDCSALNTIEPITGFIMDTKMALRDFDFTKKCVHLHTDDYSIEDW